MKKFVYTLWLLASTGVLAAAAPPPFTTIAEQSGWTITGRYDETLKLCGEFEKGFPSQVRCRTFGETPEGRPMVVLIVSADGIFDGKTARAKKRPVLFFQGGIHAGEIDGKDAGFWVVRELLRSNSPKSPLQKVVLVFVPVFNVDGHERFSAYHRPNQKGPEEMGWRTTAQNLNLNRDYTKAEAPEMEAMLRLLNEFDPILYTDLHVTDGAVFQHEISVSVQPSLKGAEPLRKTGTDLSDAMMKHLAPHLPLPFYPSFVKEDDPTSGIELWVTQPRYSHAYWGLRNRLGVLVETHSWKSYAVRVKATYDAMMSLITLGADNGTEWLKQAAKADKEEAQLGGKEIELDYAATKKSRTIGFKGVAYRRAISPISGKELITYDESLPETWQIPLFYELAPTVTVVAPKGGYVIPAAQAKAVAQKLDLHNIVYKVLTAPVAADVEVFRAGETTFSKTPFEGRTRLILNGSWGKEKENLGTGTLFVPISQPRARLAVTLLEPKGPDSFCSWGYFNAAFEKKEYMEAYVAEQVAKEMLAKDPKLANAFQQRLANEPEFAKDPAQRLEFFYRMHPSWDTHFNRYPVFRTQKVL